MMLRMPTGPGEQLTLGDRPLPGIFRGLTTSGEAVLDDRQRPNRSGSSKRPRGFSDREVRISINLAGDDPYAEAAELNGLFTQLDNRGQPQPLILIHPHVQAMGVRRVIFVRVTTGEQSTSGILTAALEFVEWRPMPKVVNREAARRSAAEALWGTALEVRGAQDAAARWSAGVAALAEADARTLAEYQAHVRGPYEGKPFANPPPALVVPDERISAGEDLWPPSPFRDEAP